MTMTIMMENGDDDVNVVKEIVAPSSSSSMTIWVGGTSALAQTYVEEIILLSSSSSSSSSSSNDYKNDYDDARSNNRYFILASPDPPIVMGDTTPTSTIPSVSTANKLFSYQNLDMTKRNYIDNVFDRILMTMTRMTTTKNNKNNYEHNSATASTTSTKPKPIKIKITIIFGMRASLVTGTQNDHMSLVEHVPYFIEQAKLRFCSEKKQELLLTGILHISSVAVMDHTKCQSMLNEDSLLPSPPPCYNYSSPYDIMKRQTEDVITSTCKNLGLIFTHLRISGIFSNEGTHHYQDQVVKEQEQDDDKNNDNKTISTGSKSCSCIQMSAIRIQAFIGSYIQTPLDMNTSRNVCNAIRLILYRMDEQQEQEHKTTTTATTLPPPPLLSNVYFYTRPTILPESYGDNLISYRSAYNIWYAIFDVPDWFARIIIWTIIYLFQILASSSIIISSSGNPKHQSWCGSSRSTQLQNILSNVSYLLTVSMVEHTFDNSRIRYDFPEINLLEESILEGFIRIRKRKEQKLTTTTQWGTSILKGQTTGTFK